MAMDGKRSLRVRIRNWVSQNRFRARKFGCIVSLEVVTVLKIYEAADSKCRYCGLPADCPDFAFPIHDGAPCIGANVVPCCEGCRIKKKRRNIIAFAKSGYLKKDDFRAIITELIGRPDGGQLRKFMLKQQRS